MIFYRPTPLDCKASEYTEIYFDDMRLVKGSIIEKFLSLTYTSGGTEYCCPDEWSYQLNANNYRYIVDELPENTAGLCDNRDRTVTIAPEYENDDAVLLHEMIHVFIGLYGCKDDFINPFGEKISICIPTFIRDALLLCLYNHLSEKIPDLDDRILAHANVHSGIEITLEGGNHDILFFLKSLDLDLRKGYPLGTVCGYGRNNFMYTP